MAFQSDFPTRPTADTAAVFGEAGPDPPLGLHRARRRRAARRAVAKLIDVSKCIGCKACQVACLEWNDMREEVGVNHGRLRQPAWT